MTRILLVEDEPLFRKGLAKLIAASGTSWSVCGEAEDGQEAERLIAQLQPELVISDIRMPLMDGLELLKRAKAARPDIEFIIITGYQDFQYAQAALRYGAFDLLVKPCSKQDIEEVLDKAYTHVLEKQAKRRQAESEQQQQLENTLRGIFLRFPYQAQAVSRLEQELAGCSLTLFQVADYFPACKQYTKRDVPLLQFAVLNIFSELLDVSGNRSTLLLIESGRFALFVHQPAEALSVYAAACDTVEQLLGLSLTAHHAGVVRHLKQLADRYEELLAHGVKVQAAADKSEGADMAPPINRSRQQLISAQLAAFIQAGQTEGLETYLEQRMEEIGTMPAEHLDIEALSLSLALQDTARKQLELPPDSQALTTRIRELHECRTLEERRVWMKRETLRFLGALTEWQGKYNASAVSRAIRFIEGHYEQPLSLQQVASHVYLNATYFSHLFKKETGRSFIHFMIELRMEKAKQLLANTELNVTEVSGRIGYDLPNYFAKLFKQFTGHTPKEYRKQHRD